VVPSTNGTGLAEEESGGGGTAMLADRWMSTILLAAALGAESAVPASAQLVVAETEPLAFDRPESWGMKYYASLAVLTSMAVPQRRAVGEIELGLEGASVPQLSDAERRIGFNGTKLEDVNKASFFGRVRGSVGVGKGLAVELAYTPPIERGGARPSIFALALGRPFELAPSWRLGIRGYSQAGTIRGDITCSAAEVAAGDDVRANPFSCVRPSEDESRQRVVGLQLVAGHDGRSRFKPYAGIGFNYLDLEFRVNALYSEGRVEDHTVETTSGITVSATAGLTYAANDRLRVTAELFYSWLSVARPPSSTSANEGFLNGRVFVGYRVN
jgi:opacity protein-like surface antigen